MSATTAPVQAGNSGRPLLDSAANRAKEQSGVVSVKLDAVKMTMNSGDLPQNVNFALKSAILVYRLRLMVQALD